MRIVFNAFLATVLLHIFSVDVDCREHLYEKGDAGTVIITTSNVDAYLAQSDSAWLVQFYSTYCGHCVSYAPKFRQLAADLHSK
jgi:thiol-disulfide isomerase/thioredoxin